MNVKSTPKPNVSKKSIFPRKSARKITESYSNWLPYATIVIAILLVSSVFLWPMPDEFPMDDTYIHFVYAENLAETGKLFFNFPDEVGVGSSSLLWVLLLASGNLLGLSMNWIAKLVGVCALAALLEVDDLPAKTLMDNLLEPLFLL